MSLSLVISNELQVKTTNKSCGTDGCCISYEHCKFLQVQAGTHFGCSVCMKEYLLTADETGAGKCFKKNNIPHCIVSQQVPNVLNNQPYCIVCERNYAQQNRQKCIYVAPEQRTENCDSYKFLDDGSIACNTCDSGYSLTRNYQCVQGCDIQNCSECAFDETGQLGCFICKDGYIGTYANATSPLYDSCITCKQWIQSLNTPSFSQCENNNKY